ncbi:glycoside hydrolase/phage tail family protein [Chelatococcus sp. SYSU_G07232]|uniref:Glycoside hydrolase/phage tail family protein n=1 Tax=Chelatococcus albus TaxID=3047466 RepID=A0ABT7AI31_9HYPH|nr:glycoside hydrolase/phage tail family protein [Chelatococcus sp. SYSU_G07232]MDJ1159019.1 glycoside hydrolase/phage tail family protein [Chelatococcus sp. SYSU_G07232]
MATLVLQVAGAAVGGLVGGPVGAVVGRALGAMAGAAVDGALFADGSTRYVEGPRLKTMEGLTSTEGAPIPRVYGRARIGGALIWATRFEEVATTTVTRAPRAGGKGAPRGPRTVTTTYAYYANIAVGLCEGPVAFLRRVWADGREIDLAHLAMRLHRGGEDQEPDPLIVAKEGAENAPAYRGLAYVVLERLPLEPFGNRIPQLSFEVVRPVPGLGSMLRAVNLIPGASEFAYDTLAVSRALDPGVTRPENRHQLQRASDVMASLDALQGLCPNLRRVSLVVSWFGDDLRAGRCRIAPRVETDAKATLEAQWSVAGLTRATAQVVSRVDGRPAYGGTPSDASILRLLRELRARGLEVVLYPFVMMDVPADNVRPDPWTGAARQPAYPWRGRITCDPAPGRPGSPDATPAAAAEVSAFFGRAAPGEFAVEGESVVYRGPEEWSLRRQALHYAHLARAAGGVEGFVLGSELVGLTRVRSAPGVYPAVEELVRLAADLRAVLGAGTRLTYAADWTEYGAHVRDGGAEVRFPLDPLWASPAIDAVGIDFYPPLADWRDGTGHHDRAAARSACDPAYLRSQVAGGEGFDWFYADAAARAAQARKPITDGAYGKPWVFRVKDLAGWWGNAHVERVAGVETAATAWAPRAKPIWLTEVGLPAVDKGANAPNVFPDAKSAEGGLPPFSDGRRDDLVQTRGLEAVLTHFDPAQPGHRAGANPISPVYGGPMVDPGRIFAWAWDARPFPAFPDLSVVWADGANWETGHWLTGRLEGVALDRLAAAILADHGLPPAAEIALDGFVDGYVVDRPMSAREALEPLARAFGFDAVAGAAGLRLVGRNGRAVATLTADELVPGREDAAFSLRRMQETELPREIRLGFVDGERDYRRAAVASRRLACGSRREIGGEVAAVLRPAEAQRLADIWLQDLWTGRETAEFGLSPRRVDLEVGDVVALPTGSAPRLFRITRIADAAERRVTARAVEPAVYDLPAPRLTRAPKPPPLLPGRPHALVLDLPLALGSPAPLQHLAVFADPWPGRLAVWRSGDGAAYDLHAVAELPAILGETLSPLGPGPLWRWDEGATVTVRLRGGALTSVDDGRALAGANTLALRGPDGTWEILTAARAELVGEGTFRLARLLRGLGGSEAAAARRLAPGAPAVVLDRALVPLATRLDEVGRTFCYRVGPAERDHADPSFLAFEATPGAAALAPLPPVHVTARRGPAGIDIAFVRRSRTGGDAWEPVEIPLGESIERYEADILSGGTVLRRLAADAPLLRYAAADELADFGMPQARLTLGLAQVSATVGRGAVRIVTVAVRAP